MSRDMSDATIKFLAKLAKRAREIVVELGLDPDDPEVLELLSDPGSLPGFRAQLKAIIARKAKR